MRKVNLLLLLAFISINCFSQRKLVMAEYFIDIDPGVNNGTKIGFSVFSDSINLDTSIIIPANLPRGIHQLYVRTKDSAGVWGIPFARSFYSADTAILSQGEYFFDNDPGIGNGIPFVIANPSDSINQSFTVSIPNNFPHGMHSLYARIKTSDGVWSLTDRKDFFNNGLTALQGAEYFYDSDPGVGNGFPLNLASPSDSTNDSFNIVTPVNLSNGMHSLYIRTRTASGLWSIPSRQDFYTYLGATIQFAEYFYDNDPGVGNGFPLVLGTGSDSTSDSFSIATPVNMSNGLHRLYVRTRTSGGLWSLPDRRDFFVFAGSAMPMAEYFYDNDPGQGNGIPLTYSIAGDSISEGFILVTPNGLSNGLHRLYIRSRTQEGLWSLTEKRDFFVYKGNLVGGEYFFDIDSGIGNGVSFELDSILDSVNQNMSINTSSLNPGWHTLYMRIKDEFGVYSHYNSSRFFIQPRIVQAEYYIDNDPGLGNGIAINWSSGNDSLNLDTSVIPSCTYNGQHLFCLRTKDELGRWSLVEVDTFYVSGYINKAHIIPGPGPDSTPVRLVGLGGAGNSYLFKNFSINSAWRSSPYFAIPNGSTQIFLIKDTLGCTLYDTIAALPKPNAISSIGGTSKVILSGYNNYVYFLDSLGKCLGAVNDFGSNLDTVTMSSYVHNSSIRYTPSSLDSFPYLNRNWKISSSSASSAKRGLHLPYTRSEFDTLDVYENAIVNNMNQLRVNRYSGINENLTIMDNDTLDVHYHYVNTALVKTFKAPNEFVLEFPSWSFSEYYISGNTSLGSLLPVELLFFKAIKLSDERIEVIWSTTSEVNVSHFEVERSYDGMNFEKIGERSATNTKELRQYQVYDTRGDKANVLYYRLRMIDLDQTVEYSKIVRLFYNENANCIVFPNPTSERLSVQSTAKVEKVEIFDVLGRLAFSSIESKSLSIAGLSGGQYFVHVLTSQGMEVIPIIVVK